jgi:hypothetical protein
MFSKTLFPPGWQSARTLSVSGHLVMYYMVFGIADKLLIFQYVLSFRGPKNAEFLPLLSISSQLSEFGPFVSFCPHESCGA